MSDAQKAPREDRYGTQLPELVGLCPDPSHMGEFYMPLTYDDSRRCPQPGCEHELVVFVPEAKLDEANRRLSEIHDLATDWLTGAAPDG